MNNRTKNMVLVSLFAALTAIGAYLEIPTQPVPFTLQILFCMYAGVLLGGKLGALSQIVYVIMGLIGLPVFAGGAGGFHHIFSPTFGYLIGFILCAFVVGKISENISRGKERTILVSFLIKIFLATIVGLAVVYALGVPYLYLIINFYLGKSMSFQGALKAGFYPFIVQDLIKCIIVTATAIKVVPILRRSGLVSSPKRQKNIQ